jgi:alkyl hydroperoxide reductase subunit AhpC
VSKLYGMLEVDAEGDASSRCAMDNRTVRSVFVIDPDKRVRLITMYPMQTGRNFTEMLRAVDSIQLTTRHPVATPAGWQQGEDVMINLMVSDERASELYGDFKAPKPYMRIIPEPS